LSIYGDPKSGEEPNFEKGTRILKRLYFIHNLYLHDDVFQASKEVCISIPTGYEWLKRWNAGGYDAMIPQFDGGAPGKLSSEQLEKLDGYIKTHEPVTTKEIKIYIKSEFGVGYSDMQIWRILQKKNLKHAKPYVKDVRRPENANELLKKNSMNT